MNAIYLDSSPARLGWVSPVSPGVRITSRGNRLTGTNHPAKLVPFLAAIDIVGGSAANVADGHPTQQTLIETHLNRANYSWSSIPSFFSEYRTRPQACSGSCARSVRADQAVGTPGLPPKGRFSSLRASLSRRGAACVPSAATQSPDHPMIGEELVENRKNRVKRGPADAVESPDGD